MRTIDETICSASVDACFQAAADVEQWPTILPHYRWVRFRERRGFASGVVEMAAWRPFGPLKYPTWWLSEMEHDRDKGLVLYRHVDGITKGMDVEWSVSESEGGGTRLRIIHDWSGPSWPLIGGVAADAVIGPYFISHIAGRTLAGVARAAEAMGPT